MVGLGVGENVGVAVGDGAADAEVDGAGPCPPDREALGLGDTCRADAPAGLPVAAAGVGEAPGLGSTVGCASGRPVVSVWRSWKVLPVEGKTCFA